MPVKTFVEKVTNYNDFVDKEMSPEWCADFQFVNGNYLHKKGDCGVTVTFKDNKCVSLGLQNSYMILRVPVHTIRAFVGLVAAVDPELCITIENKLFKAANAQ